VLLEADCWLSALALALPVARRRPVLVGGWSVSGAVTRGSSGSGRPAPITASAAAGKMSTDSRPAATSADAVTLGMARIATPIDAAVTMTGSEVACSSPAATAPRLPTVRT